MSRTRRTFDDEFKQQAVRLYLESNQTKTAISRELGISQGLLSRWVQELQPSQVDGKDIVALQAENQRLRAEVAFLKKTSAYFAQTLNPGIR